MKKLLITTITCTCIIFNLIGTGLNVKATELPPDATQGVTEQSYKDKIAADAKLKISEAYYKTHKNSQKARVAGYLHELSYYKTARQQKSNWCGPATAYNISNGKYSQSTFATKLGASQTDGGKGTDFIGKWPSVLNEAIPGNNYQGIWAGSYSDWRSKLKASIIYTIDKGYPLVADCRIKANNTNTHLTRQYKYVSDRGYDSYHYVGIVGYDDRPQIVPAEALIVDSNPNTTIPTCYWTTLDKLAAATKEYGIIW